MAHLYRQPISYWLGIFWCLVVSNQPSILLMDGFPSENRTYEYQDPITYELYIQDPTNAFLWDPLPSAATSPARLCKLPPFPSFHGQPQALRRIGQK